MYVRHIADCLAPLMGEGWSSRSHPDDPRYAELRGPDGTGLVLRETGATRPRLEVVGRYPDDEYEPVRIGLDPRRPPSELHRDITRRFLPAYFRALARARARVADRDRIERIQNGLFEGFRCAAPRLPLQRMRVRRGAFDFSAALPGRRPGGRERMVRVTGEGEGENVTLTATDLPSDVAAVLLGLCETTIRLHLARRATSVIEADPTG